MNRHTSLDVHMASYKALGRCGGACHFPPLPCMLQASTSGHAAMQEAALLISSALSDFIAEHLKSSAPPMSLCCRDELVQDPLALVPRPPLPRSSVRARAAATARSSPVACPPRVAVCRRESFIANRLRIVF